MIEVREPRTTRMAMSHESCETPAPGYSRTPRPPVTRHLPTANHTTTQRTKVGPGLGLHGVESQGSPAAEGGD